MAFRFVGQVARLDLGVVRAIVESWRQLMRAHALAWFAAEEEVAQAVDAAGRRDVQQRLVLHMAEAFASGVWFADRSRGRRATPEARVHATEASGQYLATLAMLALLVRERLNPETFELFYRPFRGHVAITDLVRE